MQWYIRTDQKLPEPNITVDTISKNGEQRKLKCGRFTTKWYNEKDEEVVQPYFWKPIDPVADAAPELFDLLKDITESRATIFIANRVRSLIERIEVKP